MGKTTGDQEQEKHKEEMGQVKAEVAKRVSQAKTDKGLIIVLTGEGKGKSSSGFGMILRCLGHGMKVGVVQFIKGQWKTGEQLFFQNNPQIKYFAMGEGFTWDTQDKKGDIERAEQCWAKAAEMIADPELDFVLIDELNVVLSFDYLSIQSVISALKAKPKSTHVVITGRGASEELVAIADTVSEVSSPKHAFDSGIRAQKGIEF